MSSSDVMLSLDAFSRGRNVTLFVWTRWESFGAPPDLPAAIGGWLLLLSRGGFKEWPLVHLWTSARCTWPMRPLPYGPRGPLMKIDKKSSHYSCQSRMFYSFKLCTVDKVHAVRPVDNYNNMPFPRQKFNSLNDWKTLKTYFVALRMFDSPPETPTGF